MIERDRVHVWFATVSALRPAVPTFLELLDDEERRRVAAYRTPEGRERFIVAHGLCRSVLGEVLGWPAADVAFTAERGGRPRLARPGVEDVRFSLSHAGDVVAVAVATGVDIGIDVEGIDPRRTDLAVAKRYFDADELRRLLDAPVASRPRAFAAAWTRLEAEAKGAGYPLEAARGRARSGLIRSSAVGSDHVASLWMQRPTTVIEHEPALLASVA
jgi:4'-phosphopantetheinyl transferase